MREAAECQRCGGDLHETLDYDSWAWRAQEPLMCLRCAALQASEKKYHDHDQRGALIHRVEKVKRRRRPGKQRRR